uniref:Uncharacterized protein n=1 Tax=Lepeophtheirus salmonis TaxID=72036 RepID=A0A0K2T1Q8_LEPSM
MEFVLPCRRSNLEVKPMISTRSNTPRSMDNT